MTRLRNALGRFAAHWRALPLWAKAVFLIMFLFNEVRGFLVVSSVVVTAQRIF
jgi:hypothetical protein